MPLAKNSRTGQFEDQEDQETLLRQQRYMQHRHEMKLAGYNPDYIGENEVQPPRCPHCTKPIPWPVINLYR